jgi:hypothetical protein
MILFYLCVLSGSLSLLLKSLSLLSFDISISFIVNFPYFGTQLSIDDAYGSCSPSSWFSYSISNLLSQSGNA